MGPRWPLLVALLSFSWPRALGAAEREPFELTFEGAAGCPTENEVREDVDGQVHDAPRAASARITLKASAEGGAFVGDLVAVDAAGRRRSAACTARRARRSRKPWPFLPRSRFSLRVSVRRIRRRRRRSLHHLLRRQPPERLPWTPRAPTGARRPRKSPSRRGFVRQLDRPWETRCATHHHRRCFPCWASRPSPWGNCRADFAPSPSPAVELGVEIEQVVPRVFAPSAMAAIVAGTSRIDQAQRGADLSWLGGRFAACPVRFGGRALSLRPCAGAEFGLSTRAGASPSLTERHRAVRLARRDPPAPLARRRALFHRGASRREPRALTGRGTSSSRIRRSTWFRR